MIISFAKKFAFVAIPKTGSQSVRSELRNHLAEHDWEQSVFGSVRLMPVNELAEIGHGHITARQIQPYLLPGMWDSFYSFAVVRNPYDRFVSYCSSFRAAEFFESDDPADFMKKTLDDKHALSHVMLQPQHKFLEDEDGRMIVSYVGKFENLTDDFDTICRKINIQNSRLRRVNRSVRRPLNSYLDNELLETIFDVYGRDFEKFGYDRTIPEGD